MSDADEEKTPTELPLSVPLSAISVDLQSRGAASGGGLPKTTVSKLSADYLPPDTRLGDWVVREKVGAGGMGAVYLVEHINRRGHAYALKVSLPPAEEEPDAKRHRLERAKREFGIVSQFDHPNIVRPGHFFLWPDPEEGFPCIIMPFVQGATLSKYCREKKPSLRFIIQSLLRPIASALEYIHRKGIRHRDIKPSNIMVDQDDVPLLMDFGIARSAASGTLTSTEVLTTFEFGAPEYLAYIGSLQRINDEPFEYEPQADVFCLGAAFYEVMTGWLPYSHIPGVRSATDYMTPDFQRALKTFEPFPASHRNPQLPPVVDELFLGMMARDPGERLSSGQEVVDVVDSLLASLPENDPVLDGDFTPPPRSKVVPSMSPSTVGARKKDAGSSRPPSAPASRSSRAPSAKPLSKPGSVVVDPSLIVEPASFKAPLPAQVAAPEEPSSQVLPSVIQRAQAQLAASTSKKPPTNVMLAGGLGLVLLLGLASMLISGNRQPADAKPQSLLDEKAPAPSVARPPPLPVLTPEPVAAVAADQTQVTFDAGQAQFAAAEQTQPQHKPVGRGNADAQAVDAILATNYGGQRPVVGQSAAHEGTSPAPNPASAKKSQPKAAWLQGDMMEEDAAKPTAKTFGVPIGTEIPARLMKPLDSRTTSSGPAVVRLARPLSVAGKVVLPSGTMLYGNATANGDRFNLKLVRLKLVDGSEFPIDASAFDNDDKKPGLKASQRIRGGTQNQGASVVAQVAKGAASTLLGVAGSGDVATEVAKGAGQTVIGNSDATPNSKGGAGDALLLDAPMDLTVFVNTTF